MKQLSSNNSFKHRVHSIVSQIPEGRVMTYGQIAGLCGNAGAARIVGGVAHYGDPDMPWHRVVNRYGGMASGYPGGRISHREHLEKEGVLINDNNQIISLQERIWHPPIS